MTHDAPKKISSTRSSDPESSPLQTLVEGEHVGMRMWVDEHPEDKDSKMHSRDYETVGYVIDGKATLYCAGEEIDLEPGDSWFVPANAEHRYEIVEAFTAVEATSPPSQRS